MGVHNRLSYQRLSFIGRSRLITTVHQQHIVCLGVGLGVGREPELWRRTNMLTPLEIKSAAWGQNHPDGDGLYLQVSPTGNKSWLFRYTRNGKTREMGLGALKTVTLAEARIARNDQRKLLHQGIDPIEHRRADRAAKVIDAAALADERRTVAQVWEEVLPRLERSDRS